MKMYISKSKMLLVLLGPGWNPEYLLLLHLISPAVQLLHRGLANQRNHMRVFKITAVARAQDRLVRKRQYATMLSDPSPSPGLFKISGISVFHPCQTALSFSQPVIFWGLISKVLDVPG